MQKVADEAVCRCRYKRVNNCQLLLKLEAEDRISWMGKPKCGS